MTRPYLTLIPILALLCLALSLAARALGSTHPPNPALRGFVEGCEDKPQPCWYGIVPGVTAIEDAPSILAQYRLNSELSQCSKVCQQKSGSNKGLKPLVQHQHFRLMA